MNLLDSCSLADPSFCHTPPSSRPSEHYSLPTRDRTTTEQHLVQPFAMSTRVDCFFAMSSGMKSKEIKVELISASFDHDFAMTL